MSLTSSGSSQGLLHTNSPTHNSWDTTAIDGWGTDWGSLSLRDFYPQILIIVQPFLKFTADESLSYALALRTSWIKIPASSSSLIMEASLRPPTNARGERERGALLQGLFGILSQSQTDVCKNLNWFYNCFKPWQLRTASNCTGGEEHCSHIQGLEFNKPNFPWVTQALSFQFSVYGRGNCWNKKSEAAFPAPWWKFAFRWGLALPRARPRQ